MTSMTPGSSHTHKDGIVIQDPGNSQCILTMVGTWSEHDSSWEVRTLPKTSAVSPYHPSIVALEPCHSQILVAYVPILICRRRAGVITLTRGVSLPTGPHPLPLERAYPKMHVILV